MRKAVLKEADARGLTGRNRENFLSKYGFGKSGPVDSTHLASMGDDKYFTSKNVIPEHRALNQVFADAVEGRVYKDGTSIITRALNDPKMIEKMMAQSGLDKKTLIQQLKLMDPIRPGGAQYPTTLEGQKALRGFYGATDQTSGVKIASAGLDQRIKVGNAKGGFIEGVKPKGKIRLDPKLDEKALAQQKTKITKSQAKTNKANAKAVAENTKVVQEDTKIKKQGITEEQRRQKKDKLVQKAKREIAEGKRKAFTPAQARAQSYLTYGVEKPTKEMRDARKAADKVVSDERKRKGAERRANLLEIAARNNNAAAKKPSFASRLKGGAGLAGVAAGAVAAGSIGGGFGDTVASILTFIGIDMAIKKIGASFKGRSFTGITDVVKSGFAKVTAKAAPLMTKAAGTMLLKATARIAGPAAIIAGLFEVVGAVEQDRIDKIRKFGDALDVTTKNMEGVSKYFGVANVEPRSRMSTVVESAATVYGSNNGDSANVLNRPSTAIVDDLIKNTSLKADFAAQIEAIKNASPEDAQALYQSLAYEISARGYADDAAGAILGAIKKEAGKENLVIEVATLDVSTKEGIAGFRKTAKNIFTKLSKITSSQKYINPAREEVIFKPGDDSGVQGVTGGFSGPQQDLLANAEAEFGRNSQEFKDLYDKFIKENTPKNSAVLKKIIPESLTSEGQAFYESRGKLFGGMLSKLGAALQSGKIDVETYDQEFKNLTDSFDELAKKSPLAALTSVKGAIKSLSPEVAKAVVGLENMADAQLILKATSLGLDLNAEDLRVLSDPQNTDDAVKGALAKKKINKQILAIQKLLNVETEKGLTDTEKQLDAMQSKIDKLQIGLDIISLKEKKVNDKYDKRLDALDKIQAANERISQQQQDQLDIADAITRGDIAGAARAMQQARTNAADRAVQDQRDALEKSRESELSKITDPLGRTRSGIEALISSETMKKLLLQFGNGKASGGYISGKGTGTSDDIPAMLSNGEYVIRAKAAKALGINTLDKMNHAEKFMMGGPVNIAKYAKGGPVNIAKYAKGGKAKSSASTLANPMDIIGRGFTTVMDGIYQNLFGGWMNNVRKGKPSVPTLEDAGTMALNALPIPGLKGARGAIAKMFGKGTKPVTGMPGLPVTKSPIIEGYHSRIGLTEGINSAGTVSINGAEYFLKTTAAGRQTIDPAFGPRTNPNTALQEYLVSDVLQRLGMNVPDMKFFPNMSNTISGLILGSKKLPGLDVMRNYEGTMKNLMATNPEAYKKLLAKFLSQGADRYAAEDAVVNAIFQNSDVHPGNLMFDATSGMVSSLDFGILKTFNNKNKSLFELLNMASSHASGMRNRLFANATPSNPQSKIDILSSANIPHTIEEIPFSLTGSNLFPQLPQKIANAKPMATRIAEALGFDLSLPTLPADFASKNPTLVQAMKALTNSNMDPEMLKFLDPQSQQTLLENVFDNIKTILNAKDATFKYAKGGMVAPKYFAKGGMVGMYAKGGDVVPSMLTPGEFVVSQPAVKNFGVDNLRAINNGTHSGDSMYNYNVSLSVNGSNANADDIARKVMQQIKRIDSQRVGGVRA
jgi:hypothetical protein